MKFCPHSNKLASDNTCQASSPLDPDRRRSLKDASPHEDAVPCKYHKVCLLGFPKAFIGFCINLANNAAQRKYLVELYLQGASELQRAVCITSGLAMHLHFPLRSPGLQVGAFLPASVLYSKENEQPLDHCLVVQLNILPNILDGSALDVFGLLRDTQKEVPREFVHKKTA